MATHFKGPILYSNARTGLSDLAIGMNPDQLILWDDFDKELDTSFTVVKDSSADVSIAADTLFGVLKITSQATTDNSGGSIQGNEIFQLPATEGQKIWFEARYFVDSTSGSGAGQMDTFVGLTENFATDPENGLDRANRIGFQMDDGSASLKVVSGTTGPLLNSQTLASKYDVVDGTYQTVGFTLTKGSAVGGTNVIEFFVNRKKVATVTDIITTELITPAAVSMSGDATGTKSMSVDYILAAQDRVTYA